MLLFLTPLAVLGPIPDWLALLGAMSAVVTALVSVVLAIVLGSLTTVRADNKDLRDGRADDKERLAQKDSELQAKDTALAEANGQVAVLKEINSGIVNWTAVTDQVAHHHERAEARWRLEDDRWTEQTDLLKQIRDKLPEPPP